MEDKTLWEYLKTLEPDEAINLIFKKYRYLCLSELLDGGKEASWKKFCLTSKHRGHDGCYACRVDMLNMKLSELDKLIKEWEEYNHVRYEQCTNGSEAD